MLVDITRIVTPTHLIHLQSPTADKDVEIVPIQAAHFHHPRLLPPQQQVSSTSRIPHLSHSIIFRVKGRGVNIVPISRDYPSVVVETECRPVCCNLLSLARSCHVVVYMIIIQVQGHYSGASYHSDDCVLRATAL